MLAASPIQPFTGTYAGNEKSLLRDLVGSVTQQEIRLSAVENKKVEKGNSINKLYPTLINGATPYSDTSYDARVAVTKFSNGMVMLSGIAVVPADDVPCMRLPVGYRPSKNLVTTITTSGGISEVRVFGDGRVSVFKGNPSWTSFEGIMFLAEQ